MQEPSLTWAVREEERRRLARLLEQELGQSLNLLLAQASAYHAALPPSVAQTIRTLTTMAGQAQADLHDLVAALHPTALNSCLHFHTSTG
ncbi:MAG: histidine kinase [Anaerolineae bacterium]